MPVSSQALYFHLGMNADDDGFIQPKTIMRTVGSADDDLKVLLSKRFILPFESGVVVIKHWLIHNLIQKDRYHPTRFQEEKNRLFIKENKSYTDNPESVNKMLTEVRLGQVRLLSANAEEIIRVPENTLEKKVTPEMQEVFDLFKGNPARFIWGTRTFQRKAASVLHKEFGIETLRNRYQVMQMHQEEELCPQVDNPADFLEKMPKMEKFLRDN